MTLEVKDSVTTDELVAATGATRTCLYDPAAADDVELLDPVAG